MDTTEKITKLKKERKEIIESASKKMPAATYIDKETAKISNIYHTIITDIKEETSDVKTFTLEADKTSSTPTLAPFKAGQYITIHLNIDSSPVTRAYSLSSSPSLANKNIYKITIKRVENGLVSNYMLDNMKVGDKLDVSKPAGNFGYNQIKDEENVIAIAGGSGITPFLSLAYAVLEGITSCNLTVFYSVKTYNDIIFKNEINEINKKNKNVKFIITLTREKKEGYFHGHLTKEMLEPFIKEFNTVLMCGPKELYRSMNEILNEFNIPRKSVHYENFFVEYEPSEKLEYKLKVVMKDKVKEITCKNDETLLVAMERAGIPAPSLCRVGECGYCRSILLDGKVKMIGASLKKAEAENDYIHPCVSFPDSDIVIKIDI